MLRLDAILCSQVDLQLAFVCGDCVLLLRVNTARALGIEMPPTPTKTSAQQPPESPRRGKTPAKRCASWLSDILLRAPNNRPPDCLRPTDPHRYPIQR